MSPLGMKRDKGHGMMPIQLYSCNKAETVLPLCVPFHWKKSLQENEWLVPLPHTPGLYLAIPLHELAELLVGWNNEQVLFQSFHQWLL
jgi:hypothetical protein